MPIISNLTESQKQFHSTLELALSSVRTITFLCVWDSSQAKLYAWFPIPPGNGGNSLVTIRIESFKIYKYSIFEPCISFNDDNRQLLLTETNSNGIKIKPSKTPKNNNFLLRLNLYGTMDGKTEIKIIRRAAT
jgi:hypothetical protein